MTLLIKNGRVIDPLSGTDETLDILLDEGKIIEVKHKIEGRGLKTIDASRLVVAPGFIDMHVHLREPGQEQKEDIRSASLAAAKGGFTSVCAMPNTHPVNDSRGVTEYIITEAKKRAVVNIFPIAAITVGLEGKTVTDMADLLGSGAVAFSDDGRCVQNALVMRQAMEKAASLKALIIDHCEDKDLSQEGVMHEGFLSRRLGLKGIPAAAEEVMVARDLILAEASKTGVHIAHLSTKGGVDLLKMAKAKKVGVTAEVTPHHLVLTDAALASRDTRLKVNPPLRGREDVQSLLDAVKDGVIDVFATDHAPHASEEKGVDFERAPFGIDGLETAVSLLLDRLVNKNLITLAKFIEMISSRPAQILGLNSKGRIAEGADADLTILNPHQEIIVNINGFSSKSRNNPFHGWKLKGVPAITVVAGRLVYPFSWQEYHEA